MSIILVVYDRIPGVSMWSQEFESRKMAEACAKSLSLKDKDCGCGMLMIEIYDENREEVISYQSGRAYKVEDNGRHTAMGASAGQPTESG